MSLFHCYLFMFCFRLFKSDIAIYIWSNGFEWDQYILFAYMAIILDALGFCMETVFYCPNLGLRLNDHFYAMGKKYMLSVCPQFLFCTKVLKVVKLQVVSSCSERNILILVNQMFQHISVLLSRLIDKLFTYSLNINIRETCIKGIKSSDDKEFRIFQLKIA